MNIKSLAKKINMDYEGLMEVYGGDVSLIFDKINNFENETAFSALAEAIQAEDKESISKAARKVKKVAEKLSITPLYDAARALQHADDNFYTLFSNVENEYKKVIAAIKEEI